MIGTGTHLLLCAAEIYMHEVNVTLCNMVVVHSDHIRHPQSQNLDGRTYQDVLNLPKPMTGRTGTIPHLPKDKEGLGRLQFPQEEGTRRGKFPIV